MMIKSAIINFCHANVHYPPNFAFVRNLWGLAASKVQTE